jgi:thiol:disulfide interchange protein DsbD
MVLGAALLVAPASAQLVRTANVAVELHAARATIAPGERFTIVLRQTIREHWHTYWRNPGDSGEPTALTWSLPQGFEAGPIQWPAPEAIPFDILVNHGYSGEILFPIEMTAPANARVGELVTLRADAYWLVCSDICIPEEASLALTLPIAARGSDDPQWAARIAAAVAALPKRELSVAAQIARGEPAKLSLTLTGEIRNPHFFAFDANAVQAAAPQRPRMGPAGLSFSLMAGAAHNLGEGVLAGVVTYEARGGAGWVRRAVEIAAAPGAALADTDLQAAPISADYALAAIEGANAVAAPEMSAAALLVALGFAFLGGLILNIMPCVLPVLSVKALAFAGEAQVGQARRHGLLYLAGVVATFLALAGALIALRGAGEAVGWGFQLQAPWVTGGLALLFFVIGLNLLGVFTIGGAIQNAGAGLSTRGGDVGAFFTGALAVVAATPCTAPFMAGAIGTALTQSAATTLVIFLALALGFALPLTALSFAPALQKRIPKPGAWMERAKNVLAFPMFAAAVWLAWVLAEQTGPAGVLALLSLAAALGFALFVGRWGRAWLLAGVIALALTAALAWRSLFGVEAEAVLSAEAWSPARVAQLRAEGRPLLVNFTAAWCVTCKLNEATTLTNAHVAEVFTAANAAYLVADWTNRDAGIAAALAERGRAGVPLYLFYPAGGSEPIVLPQVLSEALIVNAIEGDAP